MEREITVMFVALKPFKKENIEGICDKEKEGK